MISRHLLSLSVLLIAAPKLCAQLAPAEDFFNSGAQLYISNNIPAALERTEMGLKTYPNDEKLKKLAQLLKQQQEQQQQQDQQKQQQPSQNDQPKNSDEKKKQDQPQQQNQKKDQQKQSDQKKGEDQKQQEQKKDSGDKPKDDKQDQQQGQPAKAGELTPEEAKRLLDAQKGNEQLLQWKPENKSPHPQRLVRDW